MEIYIIYEQTNKSEEHLKISFCTFSCEIIQTSHHPPPIHRNIKISQKSHLPSTLQSFQACHFVCRSNWHKVTPCFLNMQRLVWSLLVIPNHMILFKQISQNQVVYTCGINTFICMFCQHRNSKLFFLHNFDFFNAQMKSCFVLVYTMTLQGHRGTKRNSCP